MINADAKLKEIFKKAPGLDVRDDQADQQPSELTGHAPQGARAGRAGACTGFSSCALFVGCGRPASARAPSDAPRSTRRATPLSRCRIVRCLRPSELAHANDQVRIRDAGARRLHRHAGLRQRQPRGRRQGGIRERQGIRRQHATRPPRQRRDAMSGNARDICVAEGEGGAHAGPDEQAEAAWRATRRKAREHAIHEIAEADYKVAKERCDDRTGNDKDVCIKVAKAADPRQGRCQRERASRPTPRSTRSKDKREADYQGRRREVRRHDGATPRAPASRTPRPSTGCKAAVSRGPGAARGNRAGPGPRTSRRGRRRSARRTRRCRSPRCESCS